MKQLLMSFLVVSNIAALTVINDGPKQIIFDFVRTISPLGVVYGHKILNAHEPFVTSMVLKYKLDITHPAKVSFDLTQVLDSATQEELDSRFTLLLIKQNPWQLKGIIDKDGALEKDMQAKEEALKQEWQQLIEQRIQQTTRSMLVEYF